MRLSTQALPLSLRSPFSDRKSTRLNSSHLVISYAVFCLKKKKRSTYRQGVEGRSRQIPGGRRLRRSLQAGQARAAILDVAAVDVQLPMLDGARTLYTLQT